MKTHEARATRLDPEPEPIAVAMPAGAGRPRLRVGKFVLCHLPFLMPFLISPVVSMVAVRAIWADMACSGWKNGSVVRDKVSKGTA